MRLDGSRARPAPVGRGWGSRTTGARHERGEQTGATASQSSPFRPADGSGYQIGRSSGRYPVSETPKRAPGQCVVRGPRRYSRAGLRCEPPNKREQSWRTSRSLRVNAKAELPIIQPPTVSVCAARGIARRGGAEHEAEQRHRRHRTERSNATDRQPCPGHRAGGRGRGGVGVGEAWPRPRARRDGGLPGDG